MKSDQDAAGSTLTLTRTTTPTSTTIELQSAGGAITRFTDGLLPDGHIQRTRVDPGGARTVLTTFGDGTARLEQPDGTVVETSVSGPDPRWGMALPQVTSRTIQLPGVAPITTHRTTTVTLASSDPFSMTDLRETVTTPKATLVRTWDAATRKVTLQLVGSTTILRLDTGGKVVEDATTKMASPSCMPTTPRVTWRP